MRIKDELFGKCFHAEAKKAIGKAGVIALVSAVGSFFFYLISWRDGTGAVSNALGNCIDQEKEEKADKEMEEDLQ